MIDRISQRGLEGSARQNQSNKKDKAFLVALSKVVSMIIPRKVDFQAIIDYIRKVGATFSSYQNPCQFGLVHVQVRMDVKTMVTSLVQSRGQLSHFAQQGIISSRTSKIGAAQAHTVSPFSLCQSSNI